MKNSEKMNRLIEWLKNYAEGHARIFAAYEEGFSAQLISAAIRKGLIVKHSDSDWILSVED